MDLGAIWHVSRIGPKIKVDPSVSKKEKCKLMHFWKVCSDWLIQETSHWWEGWSWFMDCICITSTRQTKDQHLCALVSRNPADCSNCQPSLQLLKMLHTDLSSLTSFIQFVSCFIWHQQKSPSHRFVRGLHFGLRPVFLSALKAVFKHFYHHSRLKEAPE